MCDGIALASAIWFEDPETQIASSCRPIILLIKQLRTELRKA
jgi:hypothetical protein